MAETIEIKEGQYNSADEVQVVITTDRTVQDTFTGSVADINRTIEYLNQKKTDICAQIDAEIALNQAVLEKIQPVASTATLAAPAEEIKP